MIWAYNLNRRRTFVCGALDGSYEYQVRFVRIRSARSDGPAKGRRQRRLDCLDQQPQQMLFGRVARKHAQAERRAERLEHLAVQEQVMSGNQRQSEAINGTHLEHLAVQERREARAEGDDRSRRLALVTVRRVVSILEGACHSGPLLLGLIIALPLVLRVAERTERGGIHSAIHSATEPRCDQVLQREHP